MEVSKDVIECYEMLCNAVVVQACKDYLRLLKYRDMGISPPKDISNSERFFSSQQFSLFAGGIDGQAIKKELERQYYKEKEKKKKK